MNQKTIALSTESQIIGQGVFCTCYRHPDENGLCIKIPTAHKKARKRQASDRAYYRRLHRSDANLTHIANYHGLIQTDLGVGYLYEQISDKNGRISKTIHHYFSAQPELAPQIINKLQSLGRYLLENLILISDLHGHNILLQFQNEIEAKLMIVDGIGDRVFITATNIFPSTKRSKIIRRWNRFVDKLLVEHPAVNFPTAELYLTDLSP